MSFEVKGETLYIDGCNTVDLAKKYGTPLYVVSKGEIEQRIMELKTTFLSKYENTRVAYAAKAFFPRYMARLLKENDLCVDVVSGGEIYTAIKEDFPAEKIEFNGNNKLDSEIQLALDYGVGRIIVDSVDELHRLDAIAAKMGKKPKILFRVTPGVKSSTHDYIVTGKKDSKFGIPLEDDVITPAVKFAMDSENLDLLGFHFHVGSQLFDNDSHLQALEKILNLTTHMNEELGFEIKELNLGGGFGVTYVDEERKPYSYFLDPMMEMIERFAESAKIDIPAVVIEPGRSLVANAGITLYTVGTIKEIKGIRTYVAVDGGMTDNIRPALYQAEYDAVVANKADAPKTEKVTVCGKCCESGDILIKDLMVPKVEDGDILAILSTGAYGYSMASTYNKIGVPAVALVDEGKDQIIVKRQSLDDLLRNEL